ncbi:hypothetical protein TREMEDRAFT_28299, partial [Tremella mesenterica DSM 1558]|uniref:uncharacterized protein n=1 Tax=Tremella mesenterica (strain ATCC 24925 / CBS 8224 / DSM 1558 / NBRC 9311 / NRRL Y-6157 / RJB 2259-6 / UBC 559-6) TaxID=578456 RepID=UPI0003F4A15B
LVKRFDKKTARKIIEGTVAFEDGKLYDKSLSKAIVAKVWPWLAQLVFVNFLGQMLRVTAPLLTRQILLEITRAHATQTTNKGSNLSVPIEPPRLWLGISLSVLLLFWQSIGSLCLINTAGRSSTLGVTIGSAVSVVDLISISRSLIYERRLSAKSRTQHTNGRLLTLFSSDAATMGNKVGYVLSAFSQPPQVCMGLGLVLWLLGPTALVGVAVLAVIGPLQAWGLKRLLGLRRQQEAAVDRRNRLLSEVITNIRAVKVYAWEAIFGHRISEMRKVEIAYLRRYSLYRSAVVALSAIAPVAASVLTFIAYALAGNKLDPVVVFTALHLYIALQRPVMVLPKSFAAILDLKVSIERIGLTLAAEELVHDIVIDPTALPAIDVEGQFQFDEVAPHEREQTRNQNDSPELFDQTPILASKQPFALRGLDLKIPQGALVCIVGRVGTGKSALLTGLINEIRQTHGHVIFNGQVSYVPQEAWVQSGTVRDNITFSSETVDIDFDRVDQVIDACGLRFDLEQWAEGDLTQIGERGITLSGGQRQRICLARAAYASSSIVLLDDPLSAVDAHIGHHLLENLIMNGPLANRTRVLVTHNLEVLPHADMILVMDRDEFGDGRIVQQGSYEELRQTEGIFRNLVDEFGSASQRQADTASPSEEQEVSTGEKSRQPTDVSKGPETSTKLMLDEERNVGTVSWSCYLYWVSSIKSWPWVSTALSALLLEQAISVMVSLWLGFWSNGQIQSFTQRQYVSVYGGEGREIPYSVQATGWYSMLYCGTRASLDMFNGAWNNVMRTSVGWHDRTPVRPLTDVYQAGRIMNRLTKGECHSLLSDDYVLITSDSVILSFFGTMFLVALIYPALVVIFVPVIIIDYLALTYYRQTSRELKRIHANARSEVFTTFSEQISGLSVIRAFGRQNRFKGRFQEAVVTENVTADDSSRCIGPKLVVSCQFLVMSIALFGVLSGDRVNAAQVGAVLVYVIGMTSTLSGVVDAVAKIETDMVSTDAQNNVERIKYYNELELEAPPRLPSDPPTSWPSKGEVQFDHASLRYRPELPMILKEVSFTVRPGEKVGIVGRTGAGKSSLAQALFRTVELVGGTIRVDGVDIRHVGLDTLRGQLGIIPQDAFLFGGSVRDNLDPGGDRTDQELNSALELIHSSASASSTLREKFRLDAEVLDGGANFSAGEKQLLALMRALVRGCRVLLLDEATSSVDPETDALIQRIIQTSFSDVTLISIAHRLQTVAFYDRILVLEHGEVTEFDTPLHLFDRSDGIFRGLCEKKVSTQPFSSLFSY